ncbi:MAG TPA: DUF4386 domain-containing protein [Thermoanaerobaculia bacterium]
MEPTDKAARVAGFWYLSMVLTGPFALIYVPSKLIVRGDAAATASRILDHQTMFRLAIAADLVGAVLFLGAALALYRLFAGVDRLRATQLLTLVGVSAGVGFLNTLNSIAALALFRGGEFLSVFDKPQREALGMLFIRLHSQGNTINELFWGLWLLPFGLLAIKSNFIPKFIGIWLIVNGIAYVALSFIGLFAPQYSNTAFLYAQPALFGELAVMLWLLIRGAKPRMVPAAAAA